MVAQTNGGAPRRHGTHEWSAMLDTFEALDLGAIALRSRTAEIFRATKVGAKILGISAESSVCASWLSRVHPADRAILDAAIEANGAAEIAFRFSSDDLTFRSLELQLRPCGDVMIAVLNEHTRDRDSDHAELEALLEALPFDVWQRDAQGLLIRQNAKGLDNWGARLGSSVADMGLAPDVAENWRTMNARALAGEVVRFPADYEMHGRRVNYVNLIAPVREGGKIRGIVGVNIDITATKFAEAELARAQAQLVQRERLAALGELAAVVAHEVRNPLGAIFNSLSSLRKQLALSGDAAVLFAILEEEAERLNHTVADLLNYVRPLEPDRRPEDLVELARESLRHGLRTLRTDRAPIESEVAVVNATETLDVDPTLLRIAISNLVANAVQAMPRGGKITLRVCSGKLGVRDAVAISVSDTGKGISPPILARVFEPFFTTRASGTGLGLAVVRRIVEAHHGTVTAKSDVECGTAFTLLLPR